MLKAISTACSLSLAVLPQTALAQSEAQSIAAALQTWRDACSDPNPDLALGYLIDAVATNSVDVRKACLRQVLVSDNPDVQNAALRVLMTSVPVVRFRVTEAVKPVSNSTRKLISSIQTGLLFYSTNGNQASGTATWSPIIDTPQPVPTSTGTMTVFGSDVHWVGAAHYYASDNPCTLTAALTGGSKLVGALVCESSVTIPVEASLFD